MSASKRVKFDEDSSGSESDKSDDESLGFKRKKRPAASTRREIVFDLDDKNKRTSTSGQMISSSCRDAGTKHQRQQRFEAVGSLEEEISKRCLGSKFTAPQDVTSTSSPPLVSSTSSCDWSKNGKGVNGSKQELGCTPVRASRKLQLPKVHGDELIIQTNSDSFKRSSMVDPSASQIMAQMGFDKDKGLARYAKFMAASEKKVPTLAEIEERIKMLGIPEDESMVENALVGNDDEWEEEVTWIPPEVPKVLRLEEIRSWRTLGTLEEKMAAAQRVRGVFVNNELVDKLNKCKMLFTEWDESYYQTIRHRANPFEKIGKGPFICRAAMKMANLDAILGFALTEPKSHTLEQIVRSNELLYFADVCAGPGGFTEYILWRKKWEAKGYGMTLVGELDFALNDFKAGETHSFDPYYGPGEDGNVYNPANVSGFISYVLSNSDGLGVHLMMADGGFSVEKQESMQEILSAQIILSQCLVALAIVRQGGNFVCKLFDVFTPFTVGLLYLMYLSFDLVTIHKPITSRPANSERYLICKFKREGTQAVLEYLQKCHKMLWDLSQSGNNETHIMDLVPLQLLSRMQHPFCHFIMKSNNDIARKQIRSIKEMIKYAKDPELVNERQNTITKECFQMWNVPEFIHSEEKSNTSDMCVEIISPYPKTMLCRKEKLVTTENMEAIFASPYDWRVVVVEDKPFGENRGFYMSMGGHMVYQWKGQMWMFVDLNHKRLELPARTLVYGEVVNEIFGTKPNQVIHKTFHIIDALMLGGKDIRYAHYTQRHELCTKFVKAINKPEPDKILVKVKNPVRMENVMDILDKISHRVIKSGGVGGKLVCPTDHTDETSSVILPSGLLFIKITRDPWQMALNRIEKCKYWHNKVTGKSTATVPQEAVSDFFWTSSNRILWHWDKDTNIVLTEVTCASDPRLSKLNQQKVHAITLLNHISVAIRTPPQTLSAQIRPINEVTTAPALNVSNNAKTSSTSKSSP